MYVDVTRSAVNGAEQVLPIVSYPVANAFERLPVNLSSEEIRAMIREILG